MKLLQPPSVRELLAAEADDIPVVVHWETPDGKRESTSVFIEDHDQPRAEVHRFTGQTEYGMAFTLDVWDGVEAGLIIHDELSPE